MDKRTQLIEKYESGADENGVSGLVVLLLYVISLGMWFGPFLGLILFDSLPLTLLCSLGLSLVMLAYNGYLQHKRQREFFDKREHHTLDNECATCGEIFGTLKRTRQKADYVCRWRTGEMTYQQPS